MQHTMDKKTRKGGASALYEHLIDISQLEYNKSGDIKLVIDNFKEPLKEVLFLDYIYSENAGDVFFMTIIIKSIDNFVTEIASAFPTLDAQKDLDHFNITLKAYSVTRGIWIKYE